MAAKRTPGPWRAVIGDGHTYIMVGSTRIATLHDPKSTRATPLTIANAKYIVRACNAHDNLVEALKRLVSMVDPATNRYATPATGTNLEPFFKGPVDQAWLALAKAEEGKP